MTRKINWGIIGPGRIAHKFATDLLLSENAPPAPPQQEIISFSEWKAR